MTAKHRCNVCNYIHEGDDPPDICPMCSARFPFILITEKEFIFVKEHKIARSNDNITKKQILELWAQFTQKPDFKLNPDKEHVEQVAEGVISNIKNKGQRFCPCRLSDGSKEKDLELLCPCNFKPQDRWQTHKQCWCGLFVAK